MHPLKQWKLSPIDKASLDKWDEYTAAKEAMFFHTDTAEAPWTVIKSDCKKRARLNAMRFVLHRLPYAKKDIALPGRYALLQERVKNRSKACAPSRDCPLLKPDCMQTLLVTQSRTNSQQSTKNAPRSKNGDASSFGMQRPRKRSRRAA